MATEEQIKKAHEAWRRGEGIAGVIDAAAYEAGRRDQLHAELATIARNAVLDHVVRTAVAELRAAVQQGNLPRIVAAVDALERDGQRATCNHDGERIGDEGFVRCARCGQRFYRLKARDDSDG